MRCSRRCGAVLLMAVLAGCSTTHIALKPQTMANVRRMAVTYLSVPTYPTVEGVATLPFTFEIRSTWPSERIVKTEGRVILEELGKIPGVTLIPAQDVTASRAYKSLSSGPDLVPTVRCPFGLSRIGLGASGYAALAKALDVDLMVTVTSNVTTVGLGGGGNMTIGDTERTLRAAATVAAFDRAGAQVYTERDIGAVSAKTFMSNSAVPNDNEAYVEVAEDVFRNLGKKVADRFTKAKQQQQPPPAKAPPARKVRGK